MLTLVLGGTRAGKSRFAQSLCGDGPVVVVATARRDDDPEMQDRIARHRRDRPPSWTTIEEPEDLPGAIRALDGEATVLVDCLTVWLSNLMWIHRALDRAGLDERVLARVEDFAVAARDRRVIAVSNEVGSGGVPAHPVARRFQDVQGRANQLLARRAERVLLVVAGLPLTLKDEPPGPRGRLLGS